MMIKNTLLILVVAASALTVKAQISKPNSEYPKVSSPVENADWNTYSPTQKLAKKGGFSGSAWYNYTQALRDAGETFVYYGDVTLWPDSLPVQLYSAGPSHIGIYAIGQVFDPTSEFFSDPPALTGFNRYSIDSIAFSYKYRHVVPGSVDTLIVDFFNDDKLVPLTFTGGSKTYSPTYVASTNRSSAYTSSLKIPLSENENTEEFFYPSSRSYAKTMILKLPSVMNVKGGGRMAFTITFKPGLSWAMNDTLVNGRDSINLPKKQLNTFQPFYLAAQTGVSDATFNYSIEGLRAQRYPKTANDGKWYQPWNFPGAQTRHMDAIFKLTYYNLSAKDINNQGYGLGNVYPNPVKSGSDIKIEFALGKGENLNIQLFNVLGSKVADVASGKFAAGENNVTFNTSNLAPGVYVYTISAGAFKASKKFTVID